MNTSEQPRWSVLNFFSDTEDDNDWSGDPQPHFLGGFLDDCGLDYDLYLLTFDEEESGVLGVRRTSDDESWDFYFEYIEDIDSDSIDVVREGLERAIAQGLIPVSDPGTVTDRDSELRDELPETMHKIPMREAAVFLGGTKINHDEFELYVVERRPPMPSVVFAIDCNDSDVHKVYEDGTVPKGDESDREALREAIRRAHAQGFGFNVQDKNLKFLERNTEGAPAPSEGAMLTPHPTTEINRIEKGPEALMAPNKVTKFTTVEVEHSTDTEIIVLPKGMTHAQAREWLTNDEKNKEQVIQWSATFDAYPLDGALALQRVLERRFGTAIKAGATEQTFFGKREVPPFMIEVEVGVGQTEHVPWGHFTIPLMDHKIEAGIDYKANEKQLYFQLSGEIRRKYERIMNEIADQVREELRSGSIYKSKAFRLKFPTEQEARERSFNPHDYAPRFMPVATDKDQLIFSDSVQKQIDTLLFSPVKNTARMRKLGMPLKRGVLLAGKYGTGKTLTALQLSRLCVENNWTFIYLENVDDLDRAMLFAKRYSPAVIFAEDIDQILQKKSGESRSQAVNKILNTIDGVHMKTEELMVVLTTNLLGNIEPAMLRPGRLDAIISIEPPDADAVIRLMRAYASGMLDGESDAALQPAADLLAGQIPAIIAEVVKRSKLAAINRPGVGDDIALVGEDLFIAAQGMITHAQLLVEPTVDQRSDIEKGMSLVADAIRVSGVPATVATLSNGANGAKPKAAGAETR